MILKATPAEEACRTAVVLAILEDIRCGNPVKLPPLDRSRAPRSLEFALLEVGAEDNPYGAEVGGYRYQFEGEEDLLHLIVTRSDCEPLTPEEGQAVAAFVFRGVPTGLFWFKPGKLSQHFFIGHDYLLEHWVVGETSPDSTDRESQR